jgi:hypothetical protein
MTLDASTAELRHALFRGRMHTASMLLALVLLSSCASIPNCDHLPQRTEDDIVAIARAAGTSAGYNLQRDYGSPKANFHERDCIWSVTSQRYESMPGAFFTVDVDDRSGEADVRAGY